MLHPVLCRGRDSLQTHRLHPAYRRGMKGLNKREGVSSYCCTNKVRQHVLQRSTTWVVVATSSHMHSHSPMLSLSLSPLHLNTLHHKQHRQTNKIRVRHEVRGRVRDRGREIIPENLEVVDEKCHKILTKEERGNVYGTKDNFGYDDSQRGENLVKRFYDD